MAGQPINDISNNVVRVDPTKRFCRNRKIKGGIYSLCAPIFWPHFNTAGASETLSLTPLVIVFMAYSKHSSGKMKKKRDEKNLSTSVCSYAAAAVCLAILPRFKTLARVKPLVSTLGCAALFAAAAAAAWLTAAVGAAAAGLLAAAAGVVAPIPPRLTEDSKELGGAGAAGAGAGADTAYIDTVNIASFSYWA